MNRFILPVITSSALIFGFILPSEEAAAEMTAKDLVGSYSVSETDKIFTTYIASCTFPNWNGIQRETSFSFSGDELNTTSTINTGAVHSVWKCARPASRGGS